MMGGALHDKNVNIVVGKLATMIPLFLTSTKFYSKRLDLYANKLPNYIEKSQSDPLEVKHMTRVPQQEESFNDCGLYTCLFPEYITNEVFDMLLLISMQSTIIKGMSQSYALWKNKE
ncbi:hypothetical protein MTR67_013241 [Solanum verrucosum]|uniref:Ubiquitin-like protease family profile domain-containing protein n=1 Tax=Solanum verrucosum TaxID=315347 RepID=A0AAF0QG00_SOLVR|nr:hypothetical protein MTR67_013241 [Solanum verrucosum]